MNTTFLFFYGRTPNLARFEARCVFPDAVFTSLGDGIDLVDGVTLSAEACVQRLGGITRVAKEIAVLDGLTAAGIASAIHAEEQETKEFRFILSTDEQVSVSSWVPLEVKKQLEAYGHAVRFSISKANMATAAQVLQKDTLEFSIFLFQDKYIVCKTLAIQHPNAWTKRDMGRPAVDAKRGMLPLKVARMVANMAVGSSPTEVVCCDPFCGMGSILSEGVTIGGIWYGSDISPEAVQATKSNLRWLKSVLPLPGTVEQIHVADAVHLSRYLPSESVDSIVTEPFLGNPALGERKIVQPKEIRNMMKGLEKLFIGCLKDWRVVLKPNGKVILALPSVKVQSHKETVKKVIDSCENLGYSIEAGPFVYGRPNAVVERNFYIFKKL